MLLLLLMAACAAPIRDEPSPSPAPPAPAFAFTTASMVPCTRCYEPTIAWDPAGRLFIVTGGGRNFSVSKDDGKTFEPLSPPSLPAGFSGVPGDVIVQVDPKGRLWWSALLLGSAPDVPNGGLHVARSDDGGASWALNLRLAVGAGPAQVTNVPDRQWLGFARDGAVYVVCTCPLYAAPMIARSQDDGRTFSAFAPILPAQGRPGPVGPPAIDGSGNVIVPFFLAADRADSGDLRGLGVGVAVSTDNGASFTLRTVQAVGGAPTVCCAFPSSAANNGTFFLAWTAYKGPPMVASSRDGGMTWSAAIRWGANSSGVYPHPWIAAREDRLGVAWFEQGSLGIGVHVATGGGTGPTNATRVGEDLRSPQTDFAILAQGPDGRYATVWERGGLNVAVQVGPKANGTG